MHEAGIVHGGSPDLARILDATHCCTTTATWDQQVAYSKKVAKHHVWLHANPLRLVRRAVAKSLRSPLTPEHIAAALAELHGLGWKLSCTVSGLLLCGLLGSTGLRPMPPHCTADGISGTGPARGRGSRPGSGRPRHVSGVGLLGLVTCAAF